MRLLDLFCGRWGWSRAFAARGWECFGIDLTRPPENPENCAFRQWDILLLTTLRDYHADFIVASSPCEQFSVHGMKHFHPNPPYPELGIKLFNHTRELCEAAGVPYVMENVKQAEQFVGRARTHAGSFYLWGNSVPILIPKGLVKGFGDQSAEHYRKLGVNGSTRPAKMATIPPELANCVADYAERILEQRQAMGLRGGGDEREGEN